MNKKGLTLIEIIVSTLVITLVVTGMVSAFVATNRFLINSNYRVQAYLFAREALDRLRSDYTYYSDTEMVTDAANDPTNYSHDELQGIMRGDLAGISGLNTTLRYNITEPEDFGDPAKSPYKRVSVRVRWDEFGVD
ncbi:MAG: prepilin-type N-terminal cleavage/methylation domain-containing protein [Candidatus Omnitrophota bacterium]